MPSGEARRTAESEEAMFEQSFVQPNSRVRTGWSLVTSFGLQALLLTVALAIPLVNPEILPKVLESSILLAPPAAPPGPPPDMPRVLAAASRAPAREVPSGFYEPAAIPAKPAILVDEPVETSVGDPGPYVPGSVPGAGPGHGSAFVRSLLDSARAAEAPPAQVARPVEPAKVPAAPIHVSKGVQEAMLIEKVIPRYPQIAINARVQGVVHLTALISRDGRVTQLRVLGGHPLLIPAAIEAVKQWRYRPTLLSGVPMEVVTQVDVHFTLGQ